MGNEILVLYMPCCMARELMRLAPTAPGTSRTLTTSVEVPGHPGVVLKEGMTIALAIAVGSGSMAGVQD